MSETGGVRGKRVLITGAASGIGRATAELFADKGARLVLVDQAVEELLQLVDELSARQVEAIACPGDVSSDSDCRRAVAAMAAKFGGADVLFNNAGIIRRATVLDHEESEWDRVMAVNVKGIFLMCRQVIPLMRESGAGSIVNTASGWGLTGGPAAVSYCASKGAVVLMTRAMAIDHGPDGIRVNCICPGDTDTPMLHAEAAQVSQNSQSYLAEASDRPLGRVGRPREIAETVLFLASERSSYMTGAALVVDGGGIA